MNALEAMKDGGPSACAWRPRTTRCARGRPGHRARASRPAALAQVFDPFFTTKEAGTGLGLSIVRKIVDQHGGEVRIESEPDAGTRVIVTLPRGR